MKDSDYTNRFVQPGELIFKKQHFVIQNLSFLEFVTFNDLDYIILRPVIKYYVPQDKGFFMKHKFFPANTTRGLALQTVKRIFYKDGEKRYILAPEGLMVGDTVVTSDTAEISLEEMLDPEILKNYAKQATGQKYLVTPHK